MTHSEWYDNAKSLAETLYTDETERQAVMLMLDRASDVKQGYRSAKQWFANPNESKGMTLSTVCDILGLDARDVRRRALYLWRNNE